MNIYVFEDGRFSDFFPISSTRAVFDIRFGRLTFLEQIIKLFPEDHISLIVRDDIKEIVAERHPNLDVNPKHYEDGIWILGSVVWSKDDIKNISAHNTAFIDSDRLVAANISSLIGGNWFHKGGPVECQLNDVKLESINVNQCNYLWDIIGSINKTIEQDVIDLNAIDIDDYSKINLSNPDQIYIDDANIMPGALINAEKGPVIIDKNAYVYGQTYIEGPVYIGSNTIVGPMSKIRNSVIGNNCKIGGEVESSVFQSFSNKVHEGHIGDSFIGEWVNLGAGTSNSNLKNNYNSVKVLVNDKLIDSNSIHIGCFIGDHVKTAIGTLIKTGSVINTASMISSHGFAPNYLPPFSWYVDKKLEKMDFNKFLSTAQKVKERRNMTFTSAEKALYEKIALN